MVNYPSPVVEVIPSPLGIDLAIQKIQTKLAAGLPWLEKCFARCTLQRQKTGPQDKDNAPGRDYVIPEVYNQREPMPVMMNDNLQAYCFFHARDPLKFHEYEALQTSALAKQPVALIFWGNLEKIDATKEFNFIEVLRKDVIQVLMKCSDLRLESSAIEYDNVFKPFTITETFRQFLKPPYFAMRFDGILNFDYLNC